MSVAAFSGPSRRDLLQMAVAGIIVSGAAACAAPLRVYRLAVNRDAGCGCCEHWVALMEGSGRFEPTMRDEPDMPALKGRLGVPDYLASCHTAEVEGYVIEGHVPAEDIVRLIEQHPAGVRGLAVPGMPIGSPGMEQGGRRECFNVVAFRANGSREIFSRYEAQS
jgi:hypothetical protein